MWGLGPALRKQIFKKKFIRIWYGINYKDGGKGG